MGQQVRNLLTSHSEQTTSDEWMLKLARLKEKRRLIIKATFVAYIQRHVLDWTDIFAIIKHYFWRHNSTFAVGRKHCRWHKEIFANFISCCFVCTMAFFLLWENLRYHPHTRHNSFSPHSCCSSSSLAPPGQMHSHLRRAKCDSVRTDITHPPTGDLKTDTLMTLHSNQSSFPTSDLGGAAIVAAPCNIQSQTKGEINDLSGCQCAGGWFTNTHGQEERTPPPHVKPCCSVDLITHTRCLQPTSPLFPSVKKKWWRYTINQRWANCGSIFVVPRLVLLLIVTSSPH